MTLIDTVKIHKMNYTELYFHKWRLRVKIDEHKMTCASYPLLLMCELGYVQKRITHKSKGVS